MKTKTIAKGKRFGSPARQQDSLVYMTQLTNSSDSVKTELRKCETPLKTLLPQLKTTNFLQELFIKRSLVLIYYLGESFETEFNTGHNNQQSDSSFTEDHC